MTTQFKCDYCLKEVVEAPFEVHLIVCYGECTCKEELGHQPLVCQWCYNAIKSNAIKPHKFKLRWEGDTEEIEEIVSRYKPLLRP